MSTGVRKPNGACPTWFRASCRTASQGGGQSYRDVGYSIASKLHDLAPYDIEDDEWAKRIESLANLMYPPDSSFGSGFRKNEREILDWFLRELPRCMELVPSKARGRFLEGLYHYAIEEENDITEY